MDIKIQQADWIRSTSFPKNFTRFSIIKRKFYSLLCANCYCELYMWNGSLQINVDFVSKWLFDSTKIVLSGIVQGVMISINSLQKINQNFTEIMTSLGYSYENEDNNSGEVGELEIDDSLSPLEKIAKYTKSEIFIHRFTSSLFLLFSSFVIYLIPFQIKIYFLQSNFKDNLTKLIILFKSKFSKIK